MARWSVTSQLSWELYSIMIAQQGNWAKYYSLSNPNYFCKIWKLMTSCYKCSFTLQQLRVRDFYYFSCAYTGILTWSSLEWKALFTTCLWLIYMGRHLVKEMFWNKSNTNHYWTQADAATLFASFCPALFLFLGTAKHKRFQNLDSHCGGLQWRLII